MAGKIYPPIPISELIEDKARTDAGYAIAFALMKLARAQEDVAVGIKYLGNGDAATTMGAIEAFSVSLSESLERLGDILGSALGRDDC